jgi:arylsulfatase A-like enzyme
MIDWTLKARGGDYARAVLLVAISVVGIVLPIDFLSQIDANLIYLEPWELLPVWGWAWLFYAIIGLCVGIVSAFAAFVIELISHRKPSALTCVIARWLSLSIIALALIRAVKLWLPTQNFEGLTFWMSRNQQWIVTLTLLSCGIRAVWDRKKPMLINKVILSSALAGFLLCVVAPFVSLLRDSSVSTPWPLAAASDAKIGRPDIILLTVDALAANHLGLYGYWRETTPQLEKLAEEADVFDRFYANANFTTPATNSFINGVLPWTHRANQAMARVDAAIADNGLIARLKRAGYETLAVATNPFAAPFHNGNDRWLDAADYNQTHVTYLLVMSKLGARYPHVLPTINLSIIITSCNLLDRLFVLTGTWTLTDQYDPELAFAAARRLVDGRNKSRPMFLWVHLLSPHSPYATSAPFAGEFDTSAGHRSRFDSTPPSGFLASDSNTPLTQFIGRYDEAIACSDSHIGEFLDWLKRQSLYQNALIVVTADHGESFSHHFGGHAGPELYDDVIHIPLLIKAPGQFVGARIKASAQQIDLMPTLLDYAGVLGADQVDGVSLRTVHRGQPTHDAIYSMDFEQSPRLGRLSVGTIAMIEGDWKYIHYFGYPRKARLDDSLYNLREDPAENDNLAATQPLIASRMRIAIEEQLRLHGSPVK